MTPVGQPYSASGPINLRSITATLILGTVTALLAAGMVWLWEISPIPTLVVFTQLVQAGLIGLVLAFSIHRLRLRNPNLLLIIGFACGTASVGMVHLGHYIRFVEDVAQQYRSEVEADKDLTLEQKQEALKVLETDRQKLADAFLAGKTGHTGIVGSLMFRSEVGITLKNAPVTGTAVWILWGSEMLIVAVTAAAMARSAAAVPFCEDCGDWCKKTTAPVVLPGEAAAPLAEAIRGDDSASLQALIKTPPESAGSSFAGATLHACESCDLTFADIWLRTDKVKKGKTESTTQTLVHQMSISPSLTALLCNVPGGPADSPTEEAAPGEEIVEPIGE